MSRLSELLEDSGRTLPIGQHYTTERMDRGIARSALKRELVEHAASIQTLWEAADEAAWALDDNTAPISDVQRYRVQVLIDAIESLRPFCGAVLRKGEKA